jgi:hypothetical protein
MLLNAALAIALLTLRRDRPEAREKLLAWVMKGEREEMQDRFRKATKPAIDQNQPARPAENPAFVPEDTEMTSSEQAPNRPAATQDQEKQIAE